MVRPTILNCFAGAIACAFVYYSSILLFGQHQGNAVNGVAPHYAIAHGCQIEVEGKLLQLRLGQGFETKEGWRNCQSYEGHAIVVYSNKPPKSAAMENEG